MPSAGFTLLETLIALLLRAFLTMGLTAALRVGLAYPGMTDGFSRVGPVIAVQGFLRRELSSSLALPAADWDGVAFRGAPNALEMVGAMPERAAAGGLHEVTLYHKDRQLMLRWRRFDPPDAPRERALLNGVSSAEFAYWGRRRDGETPAWYGEWPGAKFLPTLVRLRLRFVDDATDWPELVVLLPVQPDAATERP